MPAQCCLDLWNKIRVTDVPVFTLVGWDKLAESTVRYWLELARDYGVNPEKIKKAEEHLQAMIDYRKANPSEMKLPD